jgi:hypothetical protein
MREGNGTIRMLIHTFASFTLFRFNLSCMPA